VAHSALPPGNLVLGNNSPLLHTPVVCFLIISQVCVANSYCLYVHAYMCTHTHVYTHTHTHIHTHTLLFLLAHGTCCLPIALGLCALG
jgi:hypothetical protein